MTQPSATNPENTATQPCVLLVEDDRSVRRYLEITLQRSGYEVITAADGLEGMKLALTEAIDAVVTDAVMPNLGGYELARFLRQNTKLDRVPIIMLTGQQNEKTGSISEVPVDAQLFKPVKAGELTKCLRTLLCQKRSDQASS